MPSSYLYAINNEGRVFGLSTSGGMWREFMYLGLEFKQLSAVPHFMWAIGGDRQVYVHVHGLDIPIRIKEETYENERWLPLEGFSGRLLPTDRYNFSNQDGSVDRSRDKVKLPSMAWQWEGDWLIETTLDGQPLDHDGWTYAVDFPATYSTKKQWKSCVRRRKWVRYRRYSAMNSWCAIAPLHKDATKEPFIDVAIGGNQIPGGSPGSLVVWAVTAHGRVMFRVGVSSTSPEGQRWSAIKLATGYEVCQISVGVSGLVWAVLMNGKAVVRIGVTRENPMGDDWSEVEPPQADLRLVQVSVGNDAVWAVTHEGSVWFRKGIKGEMSGVCEQLSTGTGWVEMLSKMALVSVAPNDQPQRLEMPSSYLYAINNEGRVFGLSTSGGMWREFMYLGLEFKQLSAVPHFMWAIGGDRQVYVHVHGLDIPIRIKEETYENERWLPLEGFSGRLLPTDRYNFSNQDGSVDRSRDKVKLPSMAWQWEGDWLIETTLDGQPLDHDGWTYAVDFPATYSTKKQWKSCVRRRKWVRYRRYSAMNSWCAIAPLHKDATKEPFIDVAIGGNQIPGGSPGSLVVWAVTAHGRVMFRVGVSSTSPEGQRWSAIKLATGYEVCQISVGVSGLVWAVLMNGKAVVRIGVTRENPMGDDWSEVEPPQADLRLVQVSVGNDAVWAVTHEGSVWFRKGIKGEMSGVCEQLSTGTGWVEMLSKMALVSVAPNDQVWAIGYEDRCLYYRNGITRSELTGKKWRLINVPLQLSRASSNASLSSSNRHSMCGTPQQQRHQSWSSLNRPHSTSEGTALIRDWEEQSRSAPTPTSLKLWQKTNDGTPPATQQTSFQEIYNNEEKNRTGNSVEMGDLTEASVASITISNESLSQSGESIVVSGKGMVGTVKVNPAAWSPVHSVGSMVGVEAHPETDGSVFDPDLTGDSGVYGEDESIAGVYWAECDVSWSKVEAGACFVDPTNPPKWIADGQHTTAQGEVVEPWRIHILEELKNRLNIGDFDLSRCEKAIERSSWVKNGDARCKLKGSHVYEDCVIELEWISSDSGTLDSGTLTILNSDGATTMMQFPISEIVCVVCCSEPGNPRLAIHTPRLPRSKVLRLQFASDTEMEDWMGHITSVSCKMNNVYGRPGPNSIWATTALGDVFVYDPVIAEANQYVDGLYCQELDTAGKQLPFESILQNGFKPGSALHISVCVHDDADRLAFNLVCHMTTMLRHKGVCDTHDIALHFNPRFQENIIVRNIYQNGQWGDEERTGGSPLKAGSDFTLKIVCEDRGYRIYINDTEYTFFNHRIPPQSITHLRIKGLMTLHTVLYKSPMVIIEPMAMFWRQIGGHLKKVETCSSGITWGIGYDNTAWVYTGGWGGAFLKGLGASNTGINSMMDTHNYFVYENQRWNPVTGYTSHGLPTDRYMWSDVTGRHKRTREHTKLLSMHWRWVSDWIIDFHTPGGVDRDGWQYATDFPSQYHGKKFFTDYVRRRRWFRRCLLTSSGPWQELGNTKLVDVSLYVSEKPGTDSPIDVWAVAANGEALFRRGVSESCPMGVSWEHIPSDQALVGISCGPDNQVWAVGKNGSSYWRFGITSSKPIGEVWTNVEPPSGAHLKQISVGADVVWALDTAGRLSVRREIQPKIFPEGTHWQTLPSMPNDPIHIDLSVVTAKQGFRHVSVGRETGQVWAISGAGIVCRRIGITKENPAGTGWVTGIGANWQHISVGGLVNGSK